MASHTSLYRLVFESRLFRLAIGCGSGQRKKVEKTRLLLPYPYPSPQHWERTMRRCSSRPTRREWVLLWEKWEQRCYRHWKMKDCQLHCIHTIGESRSMREEMNAETKRIFKCKNAQERQPQPHSVEEKANRHCKQHPARQWSADLPCRDGRRTTAHSA